MAEILSKFDFPASVNVAKAKHPWKEWLDFQIRKLTAEDYGTAKVATIAMMARNRAKKMGLGVRLSVDKASGTIIMQAYKLEEKAADQKPTEQPTPSAPAARPVEPQQQTAAKGKKSGKK